MNRKEFLKTTGALTASTVFFPDLIIQDQKVSKRTNYSSTNDLWRMSATQLGELIRLKKASVREVIEAHIGRIKALNPSINAVTLLLEEEALKEADIKDRFLVANSKVNSLFGVPFSVKENVDLAGYSTTEGVKLLMDNIAKTSAAIQ